MNPRPTGRVRGNDLILTRSFRAPIEDVWTSVTSSESTARWMGPWEGDAGPGKTVRLQMVFEEGKPWCDYLIETCEAPRHLELRSKTDYGETHLEITLQQQGDTTEMVFVHHMGDRKQAVDWGPGWEYYLDMLVTSRTDETRPAFTDYYPSQKAHYQEEIDRPADEGGGR